MGKHNGKHHGFHKYRDEEYYADYENQSQKSRKKKKKKPLYFTYVISSEDDAVLQPGTSLSDVRFYKTAFETILWLESFVKKIKADDNGEYYYAIYQVEPAHKNIKGGEYSNGLTAYKDSTITIMQQYSIDEMAHQIRRESEFKIIPKKNSYPDNFEFAKAFYAMRRRMHGK